MTITKHFRALALMVLTLLPAVAAAQQPGYVLQTATFGPALGAPNGANFAVSSTIHWAAPFTVGTLTQVNAVGAGNIFSGNGTLFAAIVTSLGDPFTDSAVVAFTVFTTPMGGNGGNLLVPLTASLLPGEYYLVIGSGRFGATSTNAVIQVSGTVVGTQSVLFYNAAGIGQKYFPLSAAQPLRLVVTGGPETGHTFVVNSVNSFTASRASQDSVNAIGTAVGVANANILGANANILTRASQTSLDAFAQSSQASLDLFAAGVAANFTQVLTGVGTRASQASLDTLTGSVATGTQVSSIDASVGTANTALTSLSTSVGAINTAIGALPQQASLDAVTASVNQSVNTRATQASVDALAAKLEGDQSLRLGIENALSDGRRIASFLLPASVGGKLDVVRDVVDDIVVAAQQAGIKVSKARAALLKGDAARLAGNFRTAYDWYTNAYQLIARSDERDDHKDKDDRDR